MIQFLSGAVLFSDKKTVTLEVSGVGYSVFVANPESFSPGEKAKLFCTMTWNQDRGPSLFGFPSLLEKQTFDLLRECHKVGPQLSLQILSQLPPSELFTMIVDENDNGLSQINGIGPKTAKNIVSTLSDKVQDLLSSGKVVTTSGTAVLSQVREALGALGYAGPEVAEALKSISANKDTSPEFGVYMKKALGRLYSSGKK